MTAMRVLHLTGSPESEFFADLSRLYAADCLETTEDPDLYEFHVAFVGTDGLWRFPEDLSRGAIGAARAMPVEEAVAHLVVLQIDAMVPQMFCRAGMTQYRALFDLLGIPYIGNTPETMALTANKAMARAVVAATGVSVPTGEVLRPGEEPGLRAPAVVKPVDGDNSTGVTFARTEAEYDAALEAAFEHSGHALVETYVELGREVRCGIVVRDGELVCLPLEEYAVDAETHPIRESADKVRNGAGGELELASKTVDRAWIVDPSDPLNEVVWDAARRCHRALGCRHYSLFDFRIDPDGRPWFLEAGLYCSFAEQSVVATMARADGIDTAELFGIALRETVTSDQEVEV